MGAFDDLVPQQAVTSVGGAFADLIPQQPPPAAAPYDFRTRLREMLSAPENVLFAPAQDVAAARNSPLGGFARGLMDIPDQGAALVARGLQAIAPESLQPFAQQQVASVAAANKASENDYNQNWRQGAPPSFDIGRLAGNIALTAPLAAAVPGSAAAGLLPRMIAGGIGGAASGALQPVEADKPNFWGDVGGNAAMGGVFGAAAPALLSGLARLISPNTPPAVKALMAEGVNPTPGQVLGGAINRAEQGLTSVPGVGDVIKSARRETVAEFDRGAINRVLGHVGETLESPSIDRGAISEMQQKVRDAYNAAVPNAGARFDQQVVTDLANLRQLTQSLPQDLSNTFDKTLQRSVFQRMSPNGSLTGQAFKDAETELGQEARALLGNQNSSPWDRKLGDAYREAQSTLRTWLARANPAAAPEIQKANAAWAEMLRVQNASGRAGAEPGLFSPAQLQAAAKKYSSEAQFTGGRALMGDYADAGRQVLGNTVPDSGTPYRALLTFLGLGGAAAGGAPFSAPALAGYAGATGLSALLYSPLGRKALAAALASRPAAAPAVAGAVRGAGSVAPALAPAFGALGF